MVFLYYFVRPTCMLGSNGLYITGCLGERGGLSEVEGGVLVALVVRM
jgi:hypothetical protein